MSDKELRPIEDVIWENLVPLVDDNGKLIRYTAKDIFGEAEEQTLKDKREKE